MKSRILIALACISLFGIGCKSKIAADYSETITKKENSLAPQIEETRKKLVKYFALSDYDSVSSISGQMEARVDSLLLQIKNKPAPKVPEAENFKQASIRYLTYLKNMYEIYKNYGSQTSAQGRMIVQDEMVTINSQEEVMSDYLKNAQQNFAKANGFKVKRK
jgi:hypothetical protein